MKEHPQDCILLGREAPAGNHGVMAQLVSEKLNCPSVGPVIDFFLMEMDEKSVTILVSEGGRHKDSRP